MLKTLKFFLPWTSTVATHMYDAGSLFSFKFHVNCAIMLKLTTLEASLVFKNYALKKRYASFLKIP